MTTSDIARHRLANQQIAETKCKQPQEIVSWLAAMQAQEYAMAKWAVALRLPPGWTDAAIEKLFNEGAILRTHLMRPTWHFVTPADIRWLLALTAPRVQAFNAYMYRKCGLDAPLFKRSSDALAKALEGGRHLTRTALKSVLEREAGIETGDTVRLSCLMMHAELEGVICSGARQGRQFTYALLDERAPGGGAPFHREEALAELVRRYFTSRAPATLQDFSWWSGLTVKDARAGAAALDPADFPRETVNGQEFILSAASTPAALATFLMPDYDEYGIAYKNRSALSDPKTPLSEKLAASSIYSHWLVVDGVISGTWQRVEKNKQVWAEATPFAPTLSEAQQQAVAGALKRYASFAGSTEEKEE